MSEGLRPKGAPSNSWLRGPQTWRGCGRADSCCGFLLRIPVADFCHRFLSGFNRSHLFLGERLTKLEKHFGSRREGSVRFLGDDSPDVLEGRTDQRKSVGRRRVRQRQRKSDWSLLGSGYLHWPGDSFQWRLILQELMLICYQNFYYSKILNY